MLKRVKNLKLGVKIGGGFLLLIAIVIVMSLLGYKGLTDVEHNAEIALQVKEINSKMFNMEVLASTYIRSGISSDAERTNQLLDEILNDMNTLEKSMSNEADKEEVNKVINYMQDYKETFSEYKKSYEEQIQSRKDFTEEADKMNRNISELFNKKDEELLEAINSEATISEIKLKHDIVMDLVSTIEALEKVKIAEKNFIINLALAEEQEKYKNETLNAFEELLVIINELRDTMTNSEDISTVDKIISEVNITKTQFETVVKDEVEKDTEYNHLIELSDKVFSEFELIENQKNNERNAIEERSISYLIIGAVIATIIGLFIAVFITRSITNPVNQGVDYAKEIANGNFNLRNIEVKSMDEIGILTSALNEMRDKLNQSLLEVQSVGVNVSNGSDEISQGNQDLSQRTQEQASALEELSATIEEITSSIGNVADSSKKADQLSNDAMVAVQEGAEVVNQTMQSMEAITASSKEIADITNVVNDIAFQTNLLALNAAVEAARAGEHGKGFAVVAAEVRNLASRTSESSKEIEKLIGEIIKQIEDGNSLVEKTGETLDVIIKNSKETSSAISEIADSMTEQSSAANQIQGAVEELDQVTQQNASMVEEIASSSEALNSEAQTLSDIVNQFKLDSSRSVNHNFASKFDNSMNNDSKASTKSFGKQNNLDDDMAHGFDSDDFDTF